MREGQEQERKRRKEQTNSIRGDKKTRRSFSRNRYAHARTRESTHGPWS